MADRARQRWFPIISSVRNTFNKQLKGADIMFGSLKKLVRGLRGPTLQEREMAYLCDSSDRYDFEYRQRQVDQGLFRKGY